MYGIYKRGLLSTVRKQCGLDSLLWELQEDKDAEHMWKRALNWKGSHRIKKID